MTMHKILQPRYNIDILYMSRKGGGRGLASIEDSIDKSIQRLKDDIKKQIKTNYDHQKNQQNNNNEETEMWRKTTVWKVQATNWQYIRRKDQDIAKKGKEYLSNAIRPNYVKPKIEITQENSKCRYWGEWYETINHIISRCNELENNEFKTRNDSLVQGIHWD